MNVKGNENKVQKICDMLRLQTLKPAQKEAEEIIQKAEEKAKNIIEEAEKNIKQLQEEGIKNRNQQLQSFKTSLMLAAKQAIEMLKQKIDEKLFSDALNDIIKKEFSQKDVVMSLVEAIINSIKTEGIEGDIKLFLPKHFNKDEFINVLMKKIKIKLTENDVKIEDFQAGAKIKLVKDKIILDISDEAIQELLSEYMHEDYRNVFFNALK